MGLLFFALIMGCFIWLIHIGGKKLRDAKWSKNCPRCGHLCNPDGSSASNFYWKGSGGKPAYWYTCPKCGCKFNNR